MSPPRTPTNPRMQALPQPEDTGGWQAIEPPKQVTAWAAIVEKLGFPIVAFGVVIALGVGYHRHVREDAAAERTHHGDQVKELSKAVREDREALVKAIERNTAAIERLEGTMRERPVHASTERGRR